MEKDKAIKIGLLVAIIAGILIWGINFCKGKNIFTKENIYYTTYSQVEGLQKNAAVLLRGYKIGHVKDIYFTSSKYDQLTVELSINSDIFLPTTTVAKIFSSDLLGSKAIDIILPETFEEPISYVKNFDTLNSSIEASITDQVRIEVAPLKAQAEKLLESAAVAIDQIKYVVNESNGEELRRCFIKLQGAIDAIHHSGVTLDTIMTNGDENIQHILANINGITTNINEHSDEIGAIIANFSSMSDSISKANITETLVKTENAVTELNQILQQINSGHSSIGALINDKSLYDNLDQASNQLNSLLIDVQKHPKRYVSFPIFGSSKEKKEKNE
ncbi:MAG: MCE family protein [Bacteroidales bacterium]|nr:MCE family protein [Bacteroidales bacterium]